MQKHVFFYSDLCPYSTRLLQEVVKAGLRTALVLINIQTLPRERLPSTLERVPALWDPQGRRMIYGEDMEKVLTGILQAHKKAHPEFEPFNLSEMGSSLSDSYSHLEASTPGAAHPKKEGGDVVPAGNHCFAMIGETISIVTPEEGSVVDGGTAGRLGTERVSSTGPTSEFLGQSDHRPGSGKMSLEDLQAMRDQEMKKILGSDGSARPISI